MAKVDVKMPEDFLLKLSRLGSNMDAVAEKVLEAGGEVVLERVQSNLAAVVGAGTKHKSQSTGELVGALGLSPVKPDKAGNHDIKVGFAEPRSDGGSNAKIAAQNGGDGNTLFVGIDTVVARNDIYVSAVYSQMHLTAYTFVFGAKI